MCYPPSSPSQQGEGVRGRGFLFSKDDIDEFSDIGDGDVVVGVDVSRLVVVMVRFSVVLSEDDIHEGCDVGDDYLAVAVHVAKEEGWLLGEVARVGGAAVDVGDLT